MITTDEIMRDAREKEASDIHITEGMPMRYRIHGTLQESRLQAEDGETRALLCGMLDEGQLAALEGGADIDFAVTSSDGQRQRVNIFRQQGKLAATIRLLNGRIPTAEELQLPRIVTELAKEPRGLILVTGPTGSGKSTTLAAMVEHINRTRSAHIITIEDPVEYVYECRQALIHQREVGRDVAGFAPALRSALREDPDIILVGEMRDFETISVAITAAETGHLVLSTLHTIGAASTVDRVIDVFPPHQQQQIRVQFANVLEAVISQQLIPTMDGRGRVAAFEVMHANHAVRNLIREGKSHQLVSVMQTNRKMGMITMDESITQLFYEGKIDREMAIQFAQDPDGMQNKIL